MPYNPPVHQRKSIRLKGYDYTLSGAYFVTLVAWHRESLFGTIQMGEMSINPIGTIVAACWQRLPETFPVYLDEWVIMPDHFHGIIVIESTGKGEASAKFNRPVRSAPQADASPQRPIGTQPGSLGAIIQNFKSVSTRQVNQMNHTPGAHVWQRNYYERIIRNEAEWDRIRQYIQTNVRAKHPPENLW